MTQAIISNGNSHGCARPVWKFSQRIDRNAAKSTTVNMSARGEVRLATVGIAMIAMAALTGVPRRSSNAIVPVAVAAPAHDNSEYPPITYSQYKTSDEPAG